MLLNVLSVLVEASRLPMRNWNTGNLQFTKSWHGSFQTTYEELKQGRASRSDCLGCSATILLMSYWNHSATLMFPISTSFQTTYEELKPKKAIPNAAYIVLPDYLWGIETEISPYEERWYWFGFQTTYEELKLLSSPISKSRPSLPDYLWGIETCSQPTNRISLLPSFQTTYEELKPNFLAFLFCLRCHASRLPMRNWNSLPLPEVLEGYTASRLPMRNWNKSFSLVIEGMERLPDYLWGIETKVERF